MADIQNSVGFDAGAQAAAMEAQRKADQNSGPDQARDLGAEQARKSAEKQLITKLQELKKQQVQTPGRETFSRDDGVNKRFAEVMDGRQGHDAAQAALGWANNGELQQKLTEGQKRLFKEAMANDPPRATAAGQALDRLSQDQAFPKAVPGSQQMGALQAELLQNPRQEVPARQLLQTRFMQAPNADATTKGDFMRFGLQQASRGNTPAVQAAGDMLGVLTRFNTPRLAQRAAMSMAQRNPDNLSGMATVDRFVQKPVVQQLPVFARGQATALLAKADGAPAVSEGFEKLAGDPTFRAQSRDVKGRFFTTLGSGRPSELRAITDKTLVALQSENFPQRQSQVTKFLGKMGQQVSLKGADGVDVPALLKRAKSSPLPSVPTLMSTEGLSEEDAGRARAQNRAKVIHYYTQVTRTYDQVDRRLASSKYFEDVNLLPNLREAEPLDTTGLHPDEKAFVDRHADKLKGRYTGLKKTQQQRMRELRTSRISPKQRRGLEQKLRATGQQRTYFTPAQGRVGFAGAGAPRGPADSEMPQARGLPQNLGNARGLPRTSTQGPRRGQAARAFVDDGLTQFSADDILAQLPANASKNERLKKAQQLMSRHAEAQAKKFESSLKEVMAKVLGEGDPVQERADEGHAHGQDAAAAPDKKRAGQELGSRPGASTGRRGPAVQESAEQASGRAGVQGKTDGWGIPRTFERDLGGTQHDVIRPASGPSDAASAEPSYEQLSAERYKGRSLVRPTSDVRSAAALFGVKWKSMNPAETALMRNLGWSQQNWDAKQEPKARWPDSMRTRFSKLSLTQRESVRQLGLGPEDWDANVRNLGGETPPV